MTTFQDHNRSVSHHPLVSSSLLRKPPENRKTHGPVQITFVHFVLQMGEPGTKSEGIKWRLFFNRIPSRSVVFREYPLEFLISSSKKNLKPDI